MSLNNASSPIDKVTRLLARELRSRFLISNLMLGFVIGLLEVFITISFAALIYSSVTEDYLVNGIGLALLGTAVSGLYIALFAALPGTISGTQDTPAAILAVVAAGIFTALPDQTSSQDAFIIVSLSIALITIGTGLLFILVGTFSLGNLVRYLPFPVVGGFLAGTGWLLFTGALGLATAISAPLTQWRTLIQPDVLWRWLPGLLLAIVLLLLLERFKHFLILPATLIAGVLLFYIVTAVAGISVDQLSLDGWLLGPFPDGNLWTFPSWWEIQKIDWRSILSQMPQIATIMLLSLIAVLLNASGMELIAERDIELNKELRTAGIGNLLSGFGGGLINYHMLSLSALGIKSGSGSRLIGVIVSIVCLLALTVSTAFLSLFPTMVISGLVFYLGLSFLKEWVIDAFAILPRLEYAIVIFILVIIAIFGFLPGVGAGVVAAILLFVIAYSRTDVIRQALTGTHRTSRIVRSQAESHHLRQAGNRLLILRLQGFLFFGTADRLLNEVRSHLKKADKEPINIVLLDFRRVTGLDSSAVLSLRKLAQLMVGQDGQLVMTELSPQIHQQLVQNGLDRSERVHFFADLDRGLEWSEQEILQQDEFVALDTAVDLRANLAAIIPFMTRQEVGPGTVLIRQGEPPDRLYFLESGQVTAQTELPDRPPLRLETMGAGRVVGEIGFYLEQERTASVVADVPSVVYQLTRQDLIQMEKEAPEAVAGLHRLMVNLLADRVTHLIGAVNALQQ